MTLSGACSVVGAKFRIPLTLTAGETAFYRHVLNHEGTSDSLVMIQPALTSYGFEGPSHPVLLDSVSVKPDAILLLDTFFHILIHHGETVAGSIMGNLPHLMIFNDSSGSISVEEQNTYLRIMDGFLTAGSRRCTLAFWHTSLYYKKPYRKGGEIKADEIESGGTDVGCVLEEIKKSKPDLSLILTDGYYSAVDIDIKSDVIFIISKNGNRDHPMKHIGRTILLDLIK